MTECASCAILQDQVAELSALVAQMDAHIEYLRQLVHELFGGVFAIVRWLGGQIERPTMPPRRLNQTTHQRLITLVEAVQGRPM